ncbi:MAG TPA: DUF1571 domain-containing protein [Gemmataceae bacterium]|nr:DUF1571 domain-containing protein [Gemmataceae bacterium]
MHTYFIRPAGALVLLVVCLMFAPARRVTGDRPVGASPSLDAPPAPAGSTDKSFAELCRVDPVEALATSMRRYKATVEGYTCTFRKRERMHGKFRDQEVIACEFQEAPFAVLMRWTEGGGRAAAMLYSAAEDDTHLFIVPADNFAKVALRALGKTSAKRPLASAEIRDASRYPPSQFGIYNGTARAYTDWKAYQERGVLRTKYEGVRPVPELGGRPCHILTRTSAAAEPPEGQTGVTLLFDTETLLQLGAVLYAGDELLATYYFHDLKLNPKFDARHFSSERLK